MYPQVKFNLLIFGHASGCLPDNSLVASRSVIVDGNNNMELKNFANAIPAKTFEYIVFETCFMAGIDVAYEFRDKADYIVASSARLSRRGLLMLILSISMNWYMGVQRSLYRKLLIILITRATICDRLLYR